MQGPPGKRACSSAADPRRAAAHATLIVRYAMPAIREKCQLMSASEIDRTLVRLAHEILEKTQDLDKLAFIGIRHNFERGYETPDTSG
jgi:hypothetical protein